MRNRPRAGAAAPATLAAAREPLEHLIALLAREQQLLVQPAADALDAITEEKQLLLKKLHDVGLNASSMSARAQPLDPEVQELARRAQSLNTANSRLLSMHRAFCDNRVRLLRGGDSAKTLYGASGYLNG